MSIEPYEPLPAEGGGQPTAEQLVFRWLTTKRTANTRFNYGRDLGVRILRPGATEIGEPDTEQGPRLAHLLPLHRPRPAPRRPGGTRRPLG